MVQFLRLLPLRGSSSLGLAHWVISENTRELLLGKFGQVFLIHLRSAGRRVLLFKAVVLKLKVVSESHRELVKTDC